MNMNKVIFFFAILLSGVCHAKDNEKVATGRETVNLNREWTYKIGDYENAEQPLYDDTSWDPVGLPHSFSVPYFLSKDFYVGYGWYRKLIWISGCF